MSLQTPFSMHERWSQVLKEFRISRRFNKCREYPNGTPLLGEAWRRRGGCAVRKSREATLARADGVVRSNHRLSEVERTTPAAPFKGRGHLLDGAATPPFPRRGVPCTRGVKCVHGSANLGGESSLTLRLFRPPLDATVQLRNSTPTW